MVKKPITDFLYFTATLHFFYTCCHS